jgi:hypothetical protein
MVVARERLVDTAPHAHWHATTFVGAITTRGFIAPMVVDGTAFRAYVEQVLVPELRRGDTVVMDNLVAILSPECGRRSRPPGAGCCFCRRTART